MVIAKASNSGSDSTGDKYCNSSGSIFQKHKFSLTIIKHYSIYQNRFTTSKVKKRFDARDGEKLR